MSRSAKLKILVVDDEGRFARLIADHLRDTGYETAAVDSGAAAQQLIAQQYFDVVITDLRMSPVDGMAVLRSVKQHFPETEVVIMTAYGDVQTAVNAMREGAADFIQKPFPLAELSVRLERIQQQRALRIENLRLKQELADAESSRIMIGESPALKQVQALIARVAPTDTTVLITGESGTGKELVAHLVHRLSPRADKPFVTVHAAALPETLLESELFGYEKGAFTGAERRKLGRLETADGGTVFLDEVGEITPALQVKLLRFLQEKTFVRLGGSETITVDCRIVAATNRNLAQAVQEGRFREDLYYRLSVFPINVPPLRERKSDIPLLCSHILKRLGYHLELNESVLQQLQAYDWPGNIRELENVLERAVIMAAGSRIEPAHIQLPERISTGQSGCEALPEMEKRMLVEALRRAGGNKSQAAKLLGITRRMLYTRMQKFGIKADES